MVVCLKVQLYWSDIFAYIILYKPSPTVPYSCNSTDTIAMFHNSLKYQIWELNLPIISI